VAIVGAAALLASNHAPYGYCTAQLMDGQGWCRRQLDDGRTNPFPESVAINADAGVGHCAVPFPCASPPEYILTP